MILALVVYFLVGLLWDALITLDMQFVIKKQPTGVFVTSFILTVLSVSVFTEVVDEMTTPKIISLAVGSGLGSALVVWMHRKDDDCKNNHDIQHKDHSRRA